MAAVPWAKMRLILLLDCFNQLEYQNKKLLVISYWTLWHSRNKMIHDGIKPGVMEVMGFNKGYLWELGSLKVLKPTPLEANQTI